MGWIFAGVVLVLALGIGAVAVFVHRRWFRTAEPIHGSVAGVRFRHYVIPGGKNTPARIALSIATTAPGEFHVFPESTSTGLVKQVGLLKEFEVGDATLDRKFFFSGSSDEYLKAVFGVRTNVDAARAILALGFDSLEKDGQAIVASKVGRELFPIAVAKAAAEHLGRLHLPAVVAGTEGRRFSDKRLLMGLRAAGLLCMAAGFMAWNGSKPLLDGWADFVYHTAPIIIVLCIVMLATGYHALKGRSMAVRGWVEMLLFLPFMSGGFAGLLMLANQHLDRSEAQNQHARLVGQSAVKGSKRRYTYTLTFESWRGRLEEQFQVSEHVYGRARRGDVWKLRVRAGALGHPWIESLEPLEWRPGN